MTGVHVQVAATTLASGDTTISAPIGVTLAISVTAATVVDEFRYDKDDSGYDEDDREDMSCADMHGMEEDGN